MAQIVWSLVLPLRNEGPRIADLTDSLGEWVTASPGREVILVDDGSTDETPRLIEQARCRDRFRVVTLNPGQGKGAAVRRGLLEAKGDFVAFTDADLPFGLELIEALFELLSSGRGADLALAARDLEDSDTSRVSWARRMTSWVFRRWVSLVADTGPVRDTQCGAKAFRCETIGPLFEGLEQRGFAFDIEVLVLAVRLGYRIVRVPAVQAPAQGSSVRLRKDIPALAWGAILAGRSGRRRGKS